MFSALSGLMPSDMGSILAGAAATGVAIGAPLLSGFLLNRYRIGKYMPLIRRTFEIIDPILVNNLASYKPSEVRFAIELVTRVLADGKLTRAESKFVFDEVIRRYSPVRAASYKPLLENSQEEKIVQQVEKALSIKAESPTYSLEEAIELVRSDIQARVR